MVNAGEIGGVLDVILQRLSEFMEKSEKLKRKIKGAMVYPIVVMVVATVAHRIWSQEAIELIGIRESLLFAVPAFLYMIDNNIVFVIFFIVIDFRSGKAFLFTARIQ